MLRKIPKSFPNHPLWVYSLNPTSKDLLMESVGDGWGGILASLKQI